MIYSPLEQFVIYPYLNWSNISFIYLNLLILFLLLSKMISLLANHIEWWSSNIDHNLYDKLYIILTIWLFILLSNLLGMIPYTLTLTAQFIIVLSITIPVFIGINLYGLSLHGFNLLYIILPTGVPLFLTPIISLLELFSYLIRILSLTLRLSANMIAGHILMKILLSVFIASPLSSFILLPFVLLELVVALLQGYVYTTLIISYYQDILLPH